MKLNIQWKKVLYGIILIVIGIILAALHFIVAGDGIRDFISSIIAVISVLVMLVGTYITSSGIKNCKWKLSWRIQEWWRIRLYGRIWTMEKTNLWQIILKRMLHYYIYITALSQLQMNSNSHMIGLINSLYVTSYTVKDLLRLFL